MLLLLLLLLLLHIIYFILFKTRINHSGLHFTTKPIDATFVKHASRRFGHFYSSVNCWMVINKIGCHYFLCHVRVLFTIIFTGSGKSCLLGNWSLHHQEKFPKDAVVYHFAGCTSGSTGDNTFHCLFWLTFLTLTWRRDFCLVNRKWRKWTQC